MRTISHRVAILLAALGLPATGWSASVVFINELHYDNAGSDVAEGVEIAGPAGSDLGGWSLVLYNGADGEFYATEALAGVFTDQENGFGTLFFAIPGIQNGPDGLALVDPGDNVIQFLSYEGEFTAADGPAAGLASFDIGVVEDSDTPAGLSLQLTGTGRFDEDFLWSGPFPSSYGAVNTDQAFAPVPAPAALPLLAACVAALGLVRRHVRRRDSFFA